MPCSERARAHTRTHLSCHIARQLGKQGSRLGVLVGAMVQAHRVQLGLDGSLREQVRRVLAKQVVDLREVVLLCQINRSVPVVQSDAGVDGGLDVPMLDPRVHGLVAQSSLYESHASAGQARQGLAATDPLERLSDDWKDWRSGVFRQGQLFQALE